MCSEAMRDEYCDVFPESNVCSKPCGFEWDEATRQCWEEGTLVRLGSSNGTQWQKSVSVCDARAGVPCSTSGVLLGKAQSESECYDMCVTANARFCAFQVQFVAKLQFFCLPFECKHPVFVMVTWFISLFFGSWLSNIQRVSAQCNGCWKGDALKPVSESSFEKCFQYAKPVDGPAPPPAPIIGGSGKFRYY